MSLDAAVEVLAAADPDRLAALMTLPAPARPRQVALHALGAELARAPHASREPMLAEIRLQWWIDALRNLPETADRHPVLQAVADTWGVEAPPLAALGEGQRIACQPDPMSVAEALEWIDATAGAMTWIAAQALGATAESAIRAQGRALGIAAVLGRTGGVPDSIRPALRDAGRAAARTAAQSARAIGRGPVAAILYGGPVAGRALSGKPAPSEFARRFALLRCAVNRDWRIPVGR